jgi:hypothetical protein
MEYLGNALAEIAENKCGIIKRGCPVVCYPFQPKEALAVIQKTSEAMGCELTVADTGSLKIERTGLEGNTFCYNGVPFETRLIGDYQIYNAITAINAVRALKNRGYIISEEDVQNGLKTAKWPARFEVLSRSPVVIADGSHNVDGMRAFVDAAKKMLHGNKVVCVFGMLKDKEYPKCLELLSDISDTIIVTEVDSLRAETAENLASAAKKYFPNVFAEPDNIDAVMQAKQLADGMRTIVALGSLYMMKNIKEAVQKIFH